jgi:hypothetical protein
MSYRRVCESVMLGSILVWSFSSIAKAQEPANGAGAQTPANQVEALNTPPSDTPAVAVAQNPPPPSSEPTWKFQSLSYLWFPGLSGTVGARGYSAGAHVSPSDILKNLNIGIMGAFEADHQRLGLPFDYVWAKIQDKQSFINYPGYSAKATIKEGFFTPKVTYLVVDGERLKVRGTAGLRIWHLGENLQLTPPNSPSLSVGTSQNWVDVVAGANIVVPLSPKIFVMMLGDAGAGGANVDYQVAAFANYQIKPKWGIGAGYRYVYINYRNSNQVVFDTHQSGLALTLLYKYGKPAGTNQ